MHNTLHIRIFEDSARHSQSSFSFIGLLEREKGLQAKGVSCFIYLLPDVVDQVPPVTEGLSPMKDSRDCHVALLLL